MVTEIKIGHHYQNKIYSDARESVVTLPDREGVYSTDKGDVELRFEQDAQNGYRYVRIGISNLPAIQTRGKRTERLVNVSNEGKGMIILSDRVVLYVSTGATAEQFKPRQKRR